jgi:lipopolysaccharide export system permease protein
MQGVRIFEFDDNGFVSVQIAAGCRRRPGRALGAGGRRAAARVRHAQAADQARIVTTKCRSSAGPPLTPKWCRWRCCKPDRMSTIDLFDYIRHLDANGQTAQRYEIEFWRKVFYPLSCLVMVVLALPFAYLHFRQAASRPMCSAA